jgi:hypothetical protein
MMQKVCAILLMMWLLPLEAVQAHAINLTQATVIATPSSQPEEAALAMMVEEVTKRTGNRWHRSSQGADGTSVVIAGRVEQVSAILSPELRGAWARQALPPLAEAYKVQSIEHQGHATIIITGRDDRGVLYGIGHLLRSLEMEPGRAELVAPLDVVAAPEKAHRSHQIGYRFKNNTYDAWTLPQFEQEIRDLAVFGTNAIQVIAPVSDDEKVSPLFPAPATETIIGIANILNRYGLDFDLYYPAIRADYADPAQVAAELADFEALVKRFPAMHALYVPGGDPGHTAPDQLFPLLAKMAKILRRHHPGAGLWVSTQGFDQAGYEAFYRQLSLQPDWLTGIFIGPQSRDPMEVQRDRIPQRYPIQAYPDIGHTLHAQFPVADWDPALALTEGREPISPRPRDMTVIYRHFQSQFSGFVTYSEGVTDDVNKMLWSRLGWSAAISPEAVLQDYARYFLGHDIGQNHLDRAASLVWDLERNWHGPVMSNTGIASTLQGFQALDRGEANGNWRWESLLYRAYYDAYVRRRTRAELRRETQALATVADAATQGSAVVMAAAYTALAAPDDAETARLRDKLLELAGRLFQHVGLQLSVNRYGASGWERGANLDRIDVSLNNRVWLENRFREIAELTDEGERCKQLTALGQWEQPVPGALYDDLGDPLRSPHLVRGQGWEEDPQFFHTTVQSIADVTPDAGWRLSWITYGETLYDAPLTLRYKGLDPQRSYRLRVTYGGEDYHLPIRLVANGTTEIHPPLSRPSNPVTMEFPIPVSATVSGTLTLEWFRPLGMGGSGRGKQVAEVWLLPEEGDTIPVKRMFDTASQ